MQNERAAVIMNESENGTDQRMNVSGF